SFLKTHPNIVLVARNSAELEKSAAELRTSGTGNVLTLTLDVSDAQAPERLESWLAGQGLYLDVLVNNAGVGLSGDFDSHDEAAIDQLVALNVSALTRLMRAA